MIIPISHLRIRYTCTIKYAPDKMHLLEMSANPWLCHTFTPQSQPLGSQLGQLKLVGVAKWPRIAAQLRMCLTTVTAKNLNFYVLYTLNSNTG